MSKGLTIGLLGGIGPESTANFYLDLIKKTQSNQFAKIRRNEDYPHIIINSIPAPELIYGNEKAGELNIYLNGLKFLDDCNCDFIVMVCNTAHLYLAQFSREIRSPILDLPHILDKYIKTLEFEKIAILGTPSTVNKELYWIPEKKLLKPSSKELKFLSNLIFKYNLGKNNSKDDELFLELLESLRARGADYVLLGCTELAHILKEKEKIIDPLDVLGDYIVNKVFGNHRG